MATIEEIKQRRAAIVQGRWIVESHPHNQDRRSCVVTVDETKADWVCWTDRIGKQSDANIEFIANAPADIDALLAEIERLQEINQSMTLAIGKATSILGPILVSQTV